MQYAFFYIGLDSHILLSICLLAIRFDEMRPGEPMRKLSGKKRSFRDNIGGAQQDKVRNISQYHMAL